MYKFIVISIFNLVALFVCISDSTAQTYLYSGKIDATPETSVEYLENVNISIVETTDASRTLFATDPTFYEDHTRTIMGTTAPSQQWYIEQYDFPKIWSYEPIRVTKVAIIDTGISTELLSKEQISMGKNFIADDQPPIDDNGHGTALASIIYDMSGPYPIEIIPIKAANDKGLLTISSIVKAVDYAIEVDADIINLSFGAKSPHDSEQQAIDSAIKAGILVVSSVGNSGREEYFYPAAYPNVIGIGAINEQHIRSAFSTYNDFVDFVGPGEKLNVRSHTTNAYTTVEGTSFSSAYFVGQLALLKTNTLHYSLQQLAALATDLGQPGYDKEYGNGLVMTDQLLHALRGNNWPTTATTAPLKTWTITLSAPVNPEMLLENHIHIYDKNLQKQPVRIELLSTNKIAITPKFPLAPGDYWLVIDSTLQSMNGKNLTQPALKPFRVEEEEEPTSLHAIVFASGVRYSSGVLKP